MNKSNQMTISEISAPEDLDSLVSIVATYGASGAELESARTQLAHELSEAGDNRLFYIGVEETAVVAMIQLVLRNADNDPELANGKDISHIHNLQVRSELQGFGRGLRMMTYVEDRATVLGFNTLTLGVDDFNQRAIGLYHKLGYEVFKTEPGRIPQESCLCMRKFLRR